MMIEFLPLQHHHMLILKHLESNIWFNNIRIYLIIDSTCMQLSWGMLKHFPNLNQSLFTIFNVQFSVFYPYMQNCISWICARFWLVLGTFEPTMTICRLQEVTFPHLFTIFTETEVNMALSLQGLHFHNQTGKILKMIFW